MTSCRLTGPWSTAASFDDGPGLRPNRGRAPELTDDELRALIATAYAGSQMAPGLLASIEHSADWELHRQSGTRPSPESARCGGRPERRCGKAGVLALGEIR